MALELVKDFIFSIFGISLMIRLLLLIITKEEIYIIAI